MERLLGEVDAERVEPAVHQGVRVDGQPALPLLVGEHPAARLPALGRPGQVEEPHPGAAATLRSVCDSWGNATVRAHAASGRLYGQPCAAGTPIMRSVHGAA